MITVIPQTAFDSQGRPVSSRADVAGAIDAAVAISTTATATLVLPATAAATISGVLIATAQNLLCLQVLAAATGMPNYVLELFDGNPDAAGTLLYQATGITVDSYNDNSTFYLTPAAAVWARATNISAVACTITLAVHYMVVSGA